jgi:hypothetical protein
MAFTEYDHVIEARASDRADEPPCRKFAQSRILDHKKIVRFFAKSTLFGKDHYPSDDIKKELDAYPQLKGRLTPRARE